MFVGGSMFKIKRKIIKVGTSFGIILPRIWLDGNEIKGNEKVEIELYDDKIIVKIIKDKKEVE